MTCTIWGSHRVVNPEDQKLLTSLIFRLGMYYMVLLVDLCFAWTTVKVSLLPLSTYQLSGGQPSHLNVFTHRSIPFASSPFLTAFSSSSASYSVWRSSLSISSRIPSLTHRLQYFPPLCCF